MKPVTKLEEQSRRTRQRILEAADALFFTYGYQKTSVDDICARAGVTKGAFYHHFKNKESIYSSLFIPRLDHFLDEHYSLSAHPTAHERFLKLAQCTFASGIECGKELVAQNTIGMLTEHVSLLYVSERTHTRLLREAYVAAVEEELLSAETGMEMVFMLYACLMTGFLTKWASSPDKEEQPIDWDALLEMMFAHFPAVRS